MSMQPYSAKVETAQRWLADADFVLIGAGAGLSAAAGLNYQDPVLFKEWYAPFARLGLHTIWEGVTAHWSPQDQNRRRFWAFWAHHIQKIRYDAPPGAVYLDLHRLIAGKKHFMITTNVDGQFVKAGFRPEALFTPQGDYGKFQCETPCSQALYDNRDQVQHMLADTDESSLLIPESDIPRCPNCGGYLERNLRIDERFVEEPYMRKQGEYADFINASASGRLVLLEWGVGFNTPGIIRYPFERITLKHPSARLIRVNLEDASVPAEIEAKSIGFQEDIGVVMKDLVNLPPLI